MARKSKQKKPAPGRYRTRALVAEELAEKICRVTEMQNQTVYRRRDMRAKS